MHGALSLNRKLSCISEHVENSGIYPPAIESQRPFRLVLYTSDVVAVAVQRDMIKVAITFSPFSVLKDENLHKAFYQFSPILMQFVASPITCKCMFIIMPTDWLLVCYLRSFL